MPRKPDRPAHGEHMAATLAPDRVQQALAEFRKLNTREARAAFADYWIGVWAEDFEYAWPMLYELLRIVDEEQLYRDPRRVGPRAPGDQSAHGSKPSYETFGDYFADRVRHPFERWAELERAHQYAQRYAPGLLEGALAEALSAAERAERALDEAAAKHEEAIALADEVPLNGIGRPQKSSITRLNNGSNSDESYLRRRLKRDEPDLYRAVAEGSITAHSAAIRAGIRHRSQSIRIDNARSAAGTLRKHMPPDVLAELIRILTKEN